ncbi:putative non-ribosomal peptide synthetase [Xylaria venustula]|nr:putative non-ribosomal peptide synthetase [Xylaria venustula]
MSLGYPRPLHDDGLSILNANPTRLPGPSLLHELVPPPANHLASTAIDFLSENGRRVVISYPQLHTASVALASSILSILRSVPSLAASALDSQDPLIIPILSPQSPQLYVAILAVLKAGGAFCPLNTDAPPERVKFILDDVKAKIILVSRHLASKLPTDNKAYRTIFIDDVLNGLEIGRDSAPSDLGLTSENLAYVLYTSGSTGTPKGVAVSHLAATQSILAHDRHIPPFSRFLQFAAPTFDVSVFEIFFPLFRGATLVGCNRAEMLTDLAGVLGRLEVDACELTPSVAGSLLKKRSRAPSLRLLLTIGEMLTEPVIREFGGDDDKTSILWGMYGPTEASIHCTVQAAFAVSSNRRIIGVPFDTVSAFVIRIPYNSGAEFQLDVVPIGEIGELALGGLQLATYYLNRPQQTAASFLKTPWGRVYRTGDKAMMRPDGTIECLGRIDESQVKLNGQRLELGEVEQVMLRTPGCHGAVAAVISNVLVAFAAMEQASGSNAHLWAQCRSWLPAFMIPTDIIVMEQLPQLPSGKIDRKRLTCEYSPRLTNDTGNEVAIDDQERLLCEVATTVFGERVEPLTTFSTSKLDSLTAIEYSSTLRENGISITPVDILKSTTPRELRQRLGDIGRPTALSDSDQQSKCQSFNPDVEKLNLKPELGNQIQEIDRLEKPTHLQQSMLSETLKDSHLYVNQIEFELNSHIALDVLQLNLRKLAECNEILRTGFAFVENKLCQVIWKRLDDAQVCDNTDGTRFTDGVKDIEDFLLRPLRIQIRSMGSEKRGFLLLMTLHHAIYDGWTIDLIIQDLSLLLSGGLPIKRPQFSQVMTQFYSNFQVNNIDSMEYWTEHLRGVGAGTTSNFRTIAVSEQQQRTVITENIPLHPQTLKDLSLKFSVGPQVLFQASLVWLWAAIQGREDITIGCVSSGRSLPLAGIDKLMGPCMTTLPLRINISKYRTIIELLWSIHSINRETLQHGHVPLSEINKAAGLSSGSKLFDVIFAYQESLISRKQQLNVVRETWHRDATEAKLVVEVQPCGDHFVCQATSHVDVIPRALVGAFLSHFRCLVSILSSHLDPDAAIETIPKYFPIDSLSHFNRNPTTVKTFSSIPEMVERSVSQSPSTTALRFATSLNSLTMESKLLSYHDLNSRANQIARHLQQFDIASGGVIAIMMEKSPLLYCTILGILKTGCAYLPILPSTPPDRVKSILGQAEPLLCVADTKSSSLILSREFPKIIDLEIVDLSSYSISNIGIYGRPSDLAYVIYTSGTTGTPKGVAVTNRNILSNISVLSDIYPHDPSSRLLQACSQAFDVSVFEIFFTWANGMCLCAATNDTIFEDFEHAVRVFGITHLSLTVTVASLLSPHNVPTVKFLVTSGEPMTDDVLNKWSEYLYQGYGPSETTNICTVRKVSHGDSSRYLGWSFHNTSTFVLHPNSTYLVPLGCTGELCFGGDQVAAGYLRLPEESAARFIDHPHYGRLYRSGDLGRMLPDGSLIIHGRMDTQVKLRGLRIELQEIQAVALSTDDAQACRCLLVAPEDTKRQQIALFYVPSENERGDFRFLPINERTENQIQTLHSALQSSLPDYMIPTFIFPISSLPLTSSGKVDEVALRTSVWELSSSTLDSYSSVQNQADLHSDWSATETLIAHVITNSLRQEGNKISRWTTFSALGLDSISAMPVARKLQSVFQKRVPLSLLLQNPNISRLASAIDGLQDPNEPVSSYNFHLLPQELVETLRNRFTAQGKSVGKVLPCTPIQETMILSSLNFSSTEADNGVAYYNQMLLRLQIPYKVMMSLWNDLVQRHEILRTMFVISDNIRYPAVQIILNSYVPNWQILETKVSSLHERASELIASVSTNVDCDVPPMALAIIRTEDSGDYLSFICHHAIYDGISMRIMLSEIEALYHGRQLPHPPSIEPFLQEIKLSHPNQDDFWKRAFAGFQPIPLKSVEFAKDAMPRSLSANVSQTSLKLIESQLQDTGVSMLALVQTTWAITLSILCQTSDVSFGSVTNGRSISLDEIDEVVAPCFNTLPLRMDLSVSKSLIDVMKGFQSLNARVMLHQFSSLRRIQKVVDLQTRLFDTLVILQPPTTPLDDTVWSLVYEYGFMDIPIVCEVIPSELQDTLTMQLHRDTSKFSYQALQLICRIFSYIFDTCLRYPSSHIINSIVLPEDLQKAALLLFDHNSDSHAHGIGVPDSTTSQEDIWSELELTVRQTLANLAEVPEDRIKRLTPIYQYGLDSIAVIQLANLLRKQSHAISAIDVIEKPTCAGIAAAIKDFVETDSSPDYDFSSFQEYIEGEIFKLGIDIKTIEAILPCTAIQQGMLLQFLDSKGRYYLNYSSWVLEEAVDLETTASAWSHLANHHQILRTGFIPINHQDSTFAMLVYDKGHFIAPVTVYKTGTFNVEQWLSDATTDSLSTLALPPWRVALERPGTIGREGPPTIHLVMHHALYDAFTLRRLLQDLSEIIFHDIKPAVKSISHSLSHYLNLVQSSQSAGEKFWKQKADDFTAHKFPVMTPLHNNRCDTLTMSRTCETSTSNLRQAASQSGITVQAALQAAWTRLLSTYTGESRVTFGVVLDGRTTELAHNITFPMITTLPIIADNVAPNSELLQQMMQYNSELRRFQFMPMAQIQRCLNNIGAMFDTILIYQAMDKSLKSLPLHVVKEHASVEYPISLEVEESFSNSTRLTLSFRTSILPQEQATLLLDQFEAIFLDLLFSTETITSLTMSRPELFTILHPKCESLPTDTHLLHELLELSAMLVPSTVALEFIEEVTQLNSPQKWTYRELDSLGNQIAHFIARQGVSPGSIIAVCFNKCPVAYFTLLGILKAGCTFLCLDPSAPATRQTFILKDSNAVMLMVGESFDWVHKLSLPVHVMSKSMLRSLPTSRLLLQRQISPSDPCYCLYTSGTTGTPKGCLISHENATQAMAAFKHLFHGRWKSDSRWLQFAAFHFDVSVLEQYWSWYVGITVVALPKDAILSDLAMTISKLGITHIDLTPSLARFITPEECPSLCKGVFITGGEKLRSDILEVWGSERVIHNAYGPTEATIGITMYRGVPQNGRPSNIGNLFPNVGAYVFQRGSETPVLRGGVGELCVSGKLVGIGYLNREALTQERFPVLQASGERVYRTGDLVRVLHDDSLDFIGRADDQVKLRGQRLEIGEINYAIREGLSDKIGDVATIVAKRGAQDIDLLVSFIAESSNASTARESHIYYDRYHKQIAERAQESCRSRLATYMVPSFVICVSRIPLSTNNKVDINQLKKTFSELSHEQLQALSTTSHTSRLTLNNPERDLLKAIYQVVPVQESDISPNTTVFQLGIDSITATQLARQLRTMGFPSATPSMILRHPQIDQLSRALCRLEDKAPKTRSLQIKQRIKALHHRYLGLACKTLEANKEEVEYIALCTPLQQGIIARSKVREAQLAYFNQFQFRLNPGVSISRLKAAFSRIIASCSILRTSFIDTPDGIVQVAIKNRRLRWFEIELCLETFEETIAERQRHWIDANNDVLNWPIEVDHMEVDGQHYLLLRVFHGVYDARSLSIVLENWEAEYHGISWQSGPAFISILPEGPLLNHQESYQFWKSLLENHRYQPMPSLVDVPASTGSLVSQTINLDCLEDARMKLQITHQTLLQAAWLHTLRRYFVSPLTIGVINSGRSLAIDDIDLVIGPLFNTLPLRAEFPNNISWASLARTIQDQNNSLLAFVHTPLRDIQKLCANGEPLFDTLFTFDHDVKTKSKSEQALWFIDDPPTHPDYPLAIELILVADNKLRATLVAQGHIADEAALKTLLVQFTESLDSIIGSVSGAGTSIVTQGGHPKIDQHVSISDPKSNVPKDTYTATSGSPFSWDTEAYSIRYELAKLANVDEKDVSETTNFFALGLDSIDIIRLAGKLKRLGYQASVGSLMKQPTLEHIIMSLEKPSPPTASSSSTSEIDRIVSILEDCYRRTDLNFPDVEAILPPTPLQDSMVAEMLSSGFHTYFSHDVLELPPDINIDRLKSALSTVYVNSPVLRTGFFEVDDSRVDSAYCQVVRKCELKFPPTSKISSMGDIPTITDMAKTRALSSNGTSDLFQVHFAESETSKLMVLSIAHALYDGSSLNMLHKDIQAAYESNFIPRPLYKPYLTGMIYRLSPQSQDFWTGLLHEANTTLISKVYEMCGHGNFHRLEKQSKMGMNDIRTLCKIIRVTPQVIGQACWAAVLASLTKSLDVVFGVVLSGRDTEESQELMFPTMNTVPLRLTLHGTIVEFLGYCQDIVSSVVEFQYTPLRDIQKFFPSIGGQLFNTIFLLQNSGDKDIGGNSFFKSTHSVSAVEYPLSAELDISGENPVWRIACDKNYMSLKGVEYLGANLERVLEHFARGSDNQVLDFSVHDPQTVSICGLEPITLHANLQLRKGDFPVDSDASQPSASLPQGYDTMLDVLSDLSKVDRHVIDPNLSIFHIGLDSISAIKASSMLRKRGLEISTRDLVTLPSIYDILAQANRTSGKSAEATVDSSLDRNSLMDREEIRTFVQQSGLDENSIETLLPVLPIQILMLSVWQNSGGAIYFPKFSFKLLGSVKPTDLSKAWVALVGEIAILRTYLFKNGSPSLPFLQAVLHPSFTDKHATSITTESDDRWEFVYAATPFAVVQIVTELPGEANLNLYLHHALYDGISLPIILDRFAELCGSAPLVATSTRRHLWHQFALEHLTSSIQSQRKLFWTSYLNEHTAVQLFEIQQSRTGEVQRVSEFRRNTIGNIDALGYKSSSYGVSTQSLLLAAYAKAFAKCLRYDRHIDDSIDCIFGVYLANRSGHPGLEEVPFPTLNILPLRVKDPLGRNVPVIATDIQRDIAEISRLENSTASLWEIHNWTGLRIDTFVNILSLPIDSSPSSLDSITLKEISSNERTVKGSVDISSYLIAPDSESITPNVVAYSYPEVVDIEVALREDVLDIGIFGPSSIISATQASDMVTTILAEIETIE